MQETEQRLTAREMDVLLLAARGLSIEQTAETLGMPVEKAMNLGMQLVMRLGIDELTSIAAESLSTGGCRAPHRAAREPVLVGSSDG